MHCLSEYIFCLFWLCAVQFAAFFVVTMLAEQGISGVLALLNARLIECVYVQQFARISCLNLEEIQQQKKAEYRVIVLFMCPERVTAYSVAICSLFISSLKLCPLRNATSAISSKLCGIVTSLLYLSTPINVITLSNGPSV